MCQTMDRIGVAIRQEEEDHFDTNLKVSAYMRFCKICYRVSIMFMHILYYTREMSRFLARDFVSINL